MKFISYLKKISIFKTIYINLKFFKLNGLIFPILVSKNFVIKSIDGAIIISKSKFAQLKFGFNDINIIDSKTNRGIIQIDGQLRITGKVNFGIGTKLSINKSSKITIGDNFVCTGNTNIISSNSIIVGNNVLISWGVTIIDTDFHKIMINNIQKNVSKGINIGNNVWIGYNSSILKNSRISNNSVVASNSFVSKCFNEENVIIANNKVIQTNIDWER